MTSRPDWPRPLESQSEHLARHRRVFEENLATRVVIPLLRCTTPGPGQHLRPRGHHDANEPVFDPSPNIDARQRKGCEKANAMSAIGSRLVSCHRSKLRSLPALHIVPEFDLGLRPW
jgi:hypothetical protein